MDHITSKTQGSFVPSSSSSSAVLDVAMQTYQTSECEIPLVSVDRVDVPDITLTPAFDDCVEPSLTPELNKKFLGAEIHGKIRIHEGSSLFLYSRAPSTDPVVKLRTDSMYFKSYIRGSVVHALADSGAS